MDIKQAKDEIRRAVLAYTERDALGALRIPMVRQRPLLLMGPPGVGKTAIFYQLAQELGVNLVAGSVANVRGGKVYNTACVFDRASGGTEFLFDTFIGKEFHGTGDVFASVLTGALVKGKTLHEAVRLAEAFVRECAIQTMPQNIPAREGVDFEPILWKLHDGL